MTILILFATTLVGTVHAADPTLTVVVRDDGTYNPIEGARVKVYNSTYKLVGQGTTLANGTKKFSVDSDHGYYIVVSHAEYGDNYDYKYVSDDDESVYIYLDPVHYTGSVKTAAWAEQSNLNPGDRGTLKVSIYNENETYAITLVNVTVTFPWYGFYEGNWIGNDTIVEDLPVEIEAEDYWSDTLSFTVPSDSRAYGYGGKVVFNVEAPAWKMVVVMTTTGPEYKAEPELTTVKAQFTTSPTVSINYPMSDRSTNASLFTTQILLIISIICLVILIAVGLIISGRLGKQIPPAT